MYDLKTIALLLGFNKFSGRKPPHMQQECHKVGPEPIVINGVTWGPSKRPYAGVTRGLSHPRKWKYNPT